MNFHRIYLPAIGGPRSRDCIRYVVEGSDYARCAAFALIQATGLNEGSSGYGIGNDKRDKKAERVGKCGEVSFGNEVVHLPTDFTRKLGGDDGRDFVYDGKTIDVKCKMGMADQLVHVIQSTAERGPRELKCDLYVGAYLVNEIPGVSAKIDLVGWATKDEILRYCDINRSQKDSGVYNYDIPFRRMHLMSELDSVLPSLKGLLLPTP